MTDVPGIETFREDSSNPVGNTELSLELWTVIAGVSGFDD
ncbi:hypothetical protein MGWOODY_Clf2286 [hydrothermal vent metagenome]|uniref:Uncharacterized protein n=1 Tax=hydrothermal vent metagenome TaxID=652676 RepID=A0A170QA58_9ZZZZ